MHSITLTGGLADDLGELAIRKLADTLAAEVHAPIIVNVKGGKHHSGTAIYTAEPPPAKPVRLVKLSNAASHAGEKWMVQARYGKDHDGNPYNAAGGAVTFDTQDAAKEWLLTEPAGRWRVVL